MSQTSNTIAAALLAVMVLACGSGTTQHDAIEARIICQDFVKDRLKSPGTADFTGESETGKYPTFTSTGSVDSQNTFGGVVRNDYSCKVTYHPSTEKWELIEMGGLGN